MSPDSPETRLSRMETAVARLQERAEHQDKLIEAIAPVVTVSATQAVEIDTAKGAIRRIDRRLDQLAEHFDSREENEREREAAWKREISAQNAAWKRALLGQSVVLLGALIAAAAAIIAAT